MNLLVRNGVPDPGNQWEKVLIGDGDEPGEFFRHPDIPDSQGRQTMGEILLDQYVIETTKRTHFLFPFQSDLPGNYKFKGRYKMFNGLILAFLARPGRNAGEDYNRELLDAFYGLFNSQEHLSLLDRQVIRIADTAAEEDPARAASAETLMAEFREELADEVFLPEAHKLFQGDLLTALEMISLGRKDRVNAVLTTIYLHLALYFWRLAYVLEEQSNEFVRFLADPSGGPEKTGAASARDLANSPFRGQLRFRVASSSTRPYHRHDPAAASYRELDQRRLFMLSLNVALLKLARELTGSEDPATFGDIADLLARNPRKREAFDRACRAIAYSIAEGAPDETSRDDLRRLASDEENPGFLATREAILRRWRRELRRSGRDITSQLMKRGGKGLVGTRGSSLQYFEIGQDLLVLLTKLVVGNEALRSTPFSSACRYTA